MRFPGRGCCGQRRAHCPLGGRGSLTAKSLKEMGYTNVANMKGWKENGYEVE